MVSQKKPCSGGPLAATTLTSGGGGGGSDLNGVLFYNDIDLLLTSSGVGGLRGTLANASYIFGGPTGPLWEQGGEISTA